MLALAAEFPQLELVLNGGISGAAGAAEQIARGAAGAMVGRAAVNHPCAALHTVDAHLYGRPRLGLGLGLGLALTPTKTLTRTLTPAPTLNP